MVDAYNMTVSYGVTLPKTLPMVRRALVFLRVLLGNLLVKDHPAAQILLDFR